MQSQTVSETKVEIDWPRIEQSIKQRFRREPGRRANVPFVMDILKRLAPRTGPWSQGRRTLRNIGTALATDPGLATVISPICLSVPPGTLPKAGPSELVAKHVAFLESLGDGLPPWSLTCLFPPPEREDERVADYIRAVRAATQERYDGDPRIRTTMMVDYIPAMVAMENPVIDEIVRTPMLSKLSGRLGNQRGRYYQSIGVSTEQQRLRRTRRTMSQYMIVGRIAATHGWLVCNHTSANIRCYLETSAGVLHNPVGFR